MAKIHTHYDNLKVARLAPQEVIRAAYKALSQKYHPDKNPGDEKAARIMAIVNSAYGTLSDPQRRKEHDEWIAAEEWEIAWLESTRAEEGHKAQAGAHGPGWTPETVDAAKKRAREPKWWLALGACFVTGCAAGVLLMVAQPRVLPVALASAMGGKPEQRGDIKPELRLDARAPAKPDSPPDAWAAAKTGAAGQGEQRAPDVKTLAVTQLVLPAKAPECDTELHTLIAPNGEPWPAQSGYLEGYPIANKGEDTALLVDNSANASAVFVRVFDLDRRSTVRHLFVLANDKMDVDKLASGHYELRYQNVDVGADRVACVDPKARAIKQLAAAKAE